MAERPVSVPAPDQPALVEVLNLQLQWHPGFSIQQKRRNIEALHAAAASSGLSPVLEVSTKSEEALGRRLSAFNLKVHSDIAGEIPLECAFQGSKVFERGGPYTDLLSAPHPRDAKRDPRLQDSGRIVAFTFNGVSFPTEPRTLFYDWLYVNAIREHAEWLRTKSRFCAYAGFTDIEFNPIKSINCQARSCALFAALMGAGLLRQATESPPDFIALMVGRQRVGVAGRRHDDGRGLFP